MGDEEKDRTPKMSSRDQEDVDKYKKHLEDDGKGYENGPIENRTCSDIFMCILFLVFIVGQSLECLALLVTVSKMETLVN